MFPGSNSNANLGYNKHNQYLGQPPHFLVAPAGPGPGPVPGPGPGVGNPLRAATPSMPLNMQGSIDWAQLAQQWIHMRDSSAAPPPANFSMTMPIAPPPPIISNAPEYQVLQQAEMRQQQAKAQTQFEEHGEAEMDMDMEEDENENNGRTLQGVESQPPPPVVTQSQWIGNGANEMPTITHSSDANGSGTQQWTDWSTRNNPTAHIPSLLKLNVCNPNELPQLQQQTQQPQPCSSSGGGGGSGNVSSEIDANKRKMLPAWIREGLEKMEREKQRQLERQQPLTPEPESPAINVKQVSSKTLTTPVNLLNMSNVASDSEDSTAAPEEATHAPDMAHQLIGNDVLSKGSNSDGEQDDYKEVNEEEQQQQQHDVATVARAANAEPTLSGKNYEERLADLMLVVRRTLTEILLETTNEEIAAIATESLKAHRAKASSAQVIRKSALSSITGNLGLAVYGDSSSESDNDNTDDDDGGQVDRSFEASVDKTSELSSDELKARIRKSKRAFERVIDDIEERVSLQEQLDEQKLQHHRKLELEEAEAARQRALSERRHTESPADESAAAATTKTTASTNDKLQQFNGKRLSRKERTTRFSDNKDSKQVPTYVSQVVAAAAAQNSIMPQKLKPVPNPATNLLQMPESMASMLSAADKALDKANKSSKKSKRRRRQSSSSSSSSSGDSSSSSSSSGSNTSSNSSKSSSNSNDSSTRSSAATKKYGRSSQGQGRGSSSQRQRSDSSRKGHRKGHSSGSSMHNYDRHHSGHRSREHDRDRDRDRHAVHYSRQYPERRRRHHRDSSHSTEENGSSHYRRHSSSRSHQSSSYGKHRERTRSRSNSRSTHNSHSSVSTLHQQRKRK